MTFTDFCFRVLRLKLTKAQYAAARVAFDGCDPSTELEKELFGGVERVPASARSTIVLRCGRGSGKSLVAAAYGIYCLVTKDTSKCGPGDEASVIVIAPTRDLAKIAFSAGSALIRGAPAIRKMIVRDTKDSITLRRANGKEVVFRTTAKSAKGTATRGRSYLTVIFDESEFMPAGGEGESVMDADIIAAVRPRMLPDAKIILASTPWPAKSYTADSFDENFGKPSYALALRATTLQFRDNPEHLVKTREEELARDPNNAMREFDCVITDAIGCFFEASTIDRAICDVIVSQNSKASAGIDLAFRSDSSALTITERQLDKLFLVETCTRSPIGNKPLVPSEVVGLFATKSISHNAEQLVCDYHYVESAREHASNAGMDIVLGPTSASEREKSFIYLRDLFREGKIQIPRNSSLIGQLKSVLSAPRQGGGLTITLPRRRGAGHSDLVSALVLAAWYDKRHGPLLREKQTALLPVGVKTKYIWQ